MFKHLESAEHPNGQPNLHVFDVASGTIVDSRIHVQAETWRPQWSLDSQLCVRMWQGEIQFYTNNLAARFHVTMLNSRCFYLPLYRLEAKPSKRLTLKGMRHCCLSKSPKNRHLAVYTPGEKGLPSTVFVYAWQNGECVPVANKSFFRADTVSFHWSSVGTSLLVLTSTKTSETSYYGEQTLHFLTTVKSVDSASVPMPRNGPIHQVLWRPQNPNGRASEEQFVVCQGSLPSAVIVFNVKCEKIFSLGTGPWNQIYFNPQGNILLAGGFGSLNGSVTIWDYKNQRRISEFSAPNSTYLSWLPDGEHIVTAITTPRLRVDNGWILWHFSGRPVAHEAVEKRANPRPATVDLPASTEHELYQVLLRPLLFDRLPPAPIPSKGDNSATDAKTASLFPPGQLEKPKVYVPPALRNRSATATHASNVASGLPGRDLKSNAHITFTNSSGPIGGLVVESSAKSQSGGKKKKGGDHKQSEESKPSANQKQINYLKKKLNEIEKLKVLQQTTKLENTQLEKMARENDLRKELEQLQLCK
ncbi:unnamed protein product [Mesocestoides corti]|uniref:Eukaryotic translation initiation factor 2A n=1 Tax=Mesocestoides corti TaxID=53468 RepID=A0A158QVH5_MESCO|nr:unnamed protein product [Mesocestoides corti]